MAQVTIIKPDGSILETQPMLHTEAKKLFESLHSVKSGNIYVLHFV